MIKKIQCSEGTEEEADKDINFLCRNVAHPQAVNYIFYNKLSPEEIADKILYYKPNQH